MNSNSPLKTHIKQAKHQHLDKSQVMTEDDAANYVHEVISGYIKRYSIANDGSESIQAIFGPGDVFPLTPVYRALLDMSIYHGPETYYYEAMVDTEVASLSLAQLREIADKEPMIYRDLFHVAGVRLNSNIQNLENMSLRVTNRKIAHLLAYYAQKFGDKGDGGITILVPLTHQNIADSLNLARETISRRLARLEEKGIITAGKNIVVHDMTALTKEFHK